MIKLCSFAAGQNLQALCQHLNQQGLCYQMREVGDAAELWVEDQQLDLAVSLLNQARSDASVAAPAPGDQRGGLWWSIRTWPVTLLMIVLGFAGYALVAFKWDWIGYFTFTDLQLFISYMTFQSFTETYWINQQWWRLLTPAFLHFGVWHFLFNSLAMWELGRRLEMVLPRSQYPVLLVATGVAANLAQFWVSGASIFGGLSGIVFGLFGAIAVLYRRTGSKLLKLPPGLYVLAGVSLFLMPMLLGSAFDIRIANGAHVGGLVVGVLFALVLPLAYVRKVEL